MSIDTIDDVLHRLDGLIEDARRRRDRRGYFSALYRRMTRRVQLGITRGEFDDGARMERFDVFFARRYFDAWDAFGCGLPTARAWREALVSPERPRLILQYLLLGMNAHINYDLALSAYDTMRPGGVRPLERDFMKINDLLAELLDGVQGLIGRFSPTLSAVDVLGGRRDEAIADFSMRRARRDAWEAALLLDGEGDETRRAVIAEMIDRRVAGLARLIARPTSVGGEVSSLFARFDSERVEDVIDALAGA